MMRPPPPSRAAFALMWLASVLPGTVAAQSRPRPLDHDAHERWRAVSDEALSADGAWAAYELATPGEAGRLRIHPLPVGPELEIAAARDPRFTADSRFLLATVAAASPARGAPRAPDTLAVVDLARWRAGEGAAAVSRSAGLIDLQVAERQRTVVAYRVGSGTAGRVLVIRDLATAEERRVRDVGEYRLSPDGAALWYVHADVRGSADGLYRMETATGVAAPVFAERGDYTGLTLSPDGARAAFLFSPETAGAPAWQLQIALAPDRVRALIGSGDHELRPGWRLRPDVALRFSQSGTRLFFAAAPDVVELASADVDPAVSVDVWSWTDPYLQPMQQAQARQSRERSYRWVAHLIGGEVVQLEEPGGPTLQDPRTGDEPAFMAVTDEPYRQLLSWDARYVDVHVVDPLTGARTKVVDKVRGDAELSPGGKYIAWWDGDAKEWRALDVATRRVSSLSGRVPFPVYDEANDRPGPPEAYGLAAWTEGDERALLYDRFDVWSVDPSGAGDPVAVTSGAGRAGGVRFRLSSVEGGPDVTPRAAPDVLPRTGPLLLSALDLTTHEAGFWSDRVEGGQPKALLMSPHHYGAPLHAAAADRILFTRESFSESPDLWSATSGMAALARVSNANPQQAQFSWGTEELVSWKSSDGRALRGILYKPQTFDPTRRYPVVVQLYERATDDFHRYHDPSPEAASINRSFYVSRGYVVFAPDVVYRVGEPGASLVAAVVPGVQSLIDAGVADPDRIGVQGHSWGGWEAAYLLTKTDLFAAAVAGAPVANMTSAYGGLRPGTGMSRMFQYEQEQSRIGATLWETPERYIANSPLFEADRIATPLLVLHNDADDSVPWEQGIELFSALRRLGKPAWMVSYNGELHALRGAANRRDWAIRMQQFFDHYLMGEKPPVWMVEGIPAAQKGRTLGLDLVEDTPGTPMTDATSKDPSGRTPVPATSPAPAAPTTRP